MFSCEFCQIFKNTFFTEHLRMTASDTEIIGYYIKQIHHKGPWVQVMKHERYKLFNV